MWWAGLFSVDKDMLECPPGVDGSEVSIKTCVGAESREGRDPSDCNRRSEQPAAVAEVGVTTHLSHCARRPSAAET